VVVAFTASEVLLAQKPVGRYRPMTQLGSALVAVALALTAYFAIAAWQATDEERQDATLQVTMR
jgi:hypothetical protein